MGAIQLSPSSILALKTTIIAKFNEGLTMTPSNWNKVAKRIPSSSASNTYAWLSNWPAFQQWVGQRQHKKILETAYQVQNVPYETTIDVPISTIEDDTFGEWGTVAEGHGAAAVRLMDQLVFQALASGWTSLCYDGQFFFDVDHPVYPNVDGTGTPTMVQNFQAGNGNPWYLLCMNAPPLVLQERMSPVMYAQTTPESMNVFDFDYFSFGGKWRGAGAYGFWQCAYGSKASLDPNNFMEAFSAMESQVGDGGIILGTTPSILVCGPSNRVNAENILLTKELEYGESNINFHRVDLLVTPWLP